MHRPWFRRGKDHAGLHPLAAGYKQQNGCQKLSDHGISQCLSLSKGFVESPSCLCRRLPGPWGHTPLALYRPSTVVIAEVFFLIKMCPAFWSRVSWLCWKKVIYPPAQVRGASDLVLSTLRLKSAKRFPLTCHINTNGVSTPIKHRGLTLQALKSPLFPTVIICVCMWIIPSQRDAVCTHTSICCMVWMLFICIFKSI